MEDLYLTEFFFKIILQDKVFCIEPSKVAWKSMEQLFDLDKPAQICHLGYISESICQVRCATESVASSYGIS